MRNFWFIQTLVGFIGTGILMYIFLFSEINPFLAGMILNVCVSYFALSFSNYIFVRNNKSTSEMSKFGLPSISLIAFASLCVSIVFPIYFKSLWNITLALHVVIFGIGLFQLIPKSRQLFNKITKLGLILCISFLSILILFELELPILYSVFGIMLFAESVLVLCSIVLHKERSIKEELSVK